MDIDYFANYEIVGVCGDVPFFQRYLTQKYDSLSVDPYGSNLFSRFLNQQITKEEYIRLIESGEWVAEEMKDFMPGWGHRWLINNVDTPQIAEEIKKAGGLLIRLSRDDWFDNPTGIDMYKGFDLTINVRTYAYSDKDAPRRLFDLINKLLSKNERGVYCIL